MSRVRVLIVDDDDLVREALEILLADVPELAIVGSAVNGLEGVSAAAALMPDLVLMDMRMPVMDGIRATARILAAGTARGVLMLSAYPDQALADEARQAGVAEFIAKGAPPQELIEAILRVAAEAPPEGAAVPPGAARLRPRA